MQVLIPVRTILIYYLFEYRLEGFVCGLRQSIRMLIVRYVAFMHYRVERRQAFHDLPQEVIALVVDELNRAPVSAPYVLI